MNRTGTSQAVRELAAWLVASEADTDVSSEDRSASCRVCEKFRRPLSHLTGPAGFSSLFRRALTLAQREEPQLRSVQVTSSGALEGLNGDAAEVSATLVAHLIALLTSFIGESLTLQLLRDTWPDLPTSEPVLEKDKI